MKEKQRPLLEQAMLDSPRHDGLIRDRMRRVVTFSELTKSDFGYNLKRKEEWNLKRKDITFHYTSKSPIGYHDSDRLFFDEPDPNKRSSLVNLIVGDLTIRYTICSDYGVQLRYHGNQKRSKNSRLNSRCLGAYGPTC